MSTDDFTVIVADFMYLVIIGPIDIIDKVTETINNKNMLSIPIETPCAELLLMDKIKHIIYQDAKKRILVDQHDDQQFEDQINTIKKYAIFGEGVESAQCLVYADGYRDLNMLMEITDEKTNFKISFPIIQLDEEITPDVLISNWIIENKIQHLINDITIRPVSIVGNGNDILVFIAQINSS